ncbi:MAG TPA: hydroxymethylbilane synthase [Gammaproteobacteria bacterium]|jgi:hydroxymethylbilane synthase|nr:hydroxymethylbilane synthase [Gammaproteobacteria bacterium]
MSPSPIRIATRKSALALWQAEHVAMRLRALEPGRPVELVPMTTEGDRNLGASLAASGGKGLFVKELEVALAEGRADLAVHSMKDVPVLLAPEFTLAAVLEREDPRDAFLSVKHRSFDALPQGARVGSSSLRRQAQLLHRRPDLKVEPLRGNVDTRLRKLEEGQYDAIVLAVAGLKRLGLAAHITAVLDPAVSLPAITQGIIALECRAGDAETLALTARLNHGPTWTQALAERALSRGLSGSCNLPLAGHAALEGGMLSLTGRVGSPDGKRLLEAALSGPATEAESLGLKLAQALLAQGAGEVLRDVESKV